MTNKRQAGQSLVEGTFVLLLFFAALFSVVDAGQALVAHQSLVDRVRSAARWGVVHHFDGTGDEIANLVLYGQTREPLGTSVGYLGLKRENVSVTFQSASSARPDDEILHVQIVNYRQTFLSPWISGGLISPSPVAISSRMAYRDPLVETAAR